MKTYKGKFKPNNRSKYKGDPTDIVYRSGWEKSVMLWCDKTANVVEWSSEEVVIPYLFEVDNKVHRYFMDFYIKFKDGKVLLVEVKPHKQTSPPEGKRRTKKFLEEAVTYVKNRNKWEAAAEYAANKGWEFQIWTENELRAMGILPKPFKPLKPLKKKTNARKNKKSG